MSKDDHAPFKTLSMRLDGMIAVVTGTGRGLGRACAFALTAADVEVVLISRTASDLQRCKNLPIGSMEEKSGSERWRSPVLQLQP
jgi:NAD(P)-dependent dehydrogenase (short-subunit alcohol dehydrogenase family)